MATATKQITRTPASSHEQQQQSSSRTTLAISSDPEKALHLSPNFQPDVDLLTAEGVIAFGVKGSGKSNLLALIVEQLRRFFLPQLIFDTEREYQSLLPLLPHGMIATAQRCPSGHDILQYGLQVIVDLQSWDSDEAAAQAMCQLADELFAAASAIAPQDRFSCVIHLDEAGYWLPQDAVSYLSKETRKALADAFHKLATRGRKQGLSPFLYTQSISEIEKSVIRQAGVKILMRQTLDVDLARYCRYLHGATATTRRAIQAFPKGRAIVVLPDGSQHKFQFHERESEHTSHTPQAQTALVKFATMDLDVEALALRDLTTASSSERGKQQRGTSASPQTVTARIYELLDSDPTLRPVDLMKLTGCGQTHAVRARLTYFAEHPERAIETVKHAERSTTPTAREQVYALLDKHPMLTARQLADQVGCSFSLASMYRNDYGAPLAPKKVGKIERQLRALLQENPHYTVPQLQHRTGTNGVYIQRVLDRLHAEQAAAAQGDRSGTSPQQTSRERVFTLLARDNMLTNQQLADQAGCSLRTASRWGAVYRKGL